MTWLKLGDEFSKECRRARISSDAFRLHVEGLCFAMDDENGGVIYEDDIEAFARVPKPFEAVLELENVNFWERVGHGKWQIVHQMNHQPAADVLAARRASNAERQQRKRRKDAGLMVEDAKPSRRESRRDTPRDDPRDPVRFGPVLDGAGQEKDLEVSTDRREQAEVPAPRPSPAGPCFCGGVGYPNGRPCPDCGATNTRGTRP